MKVVLINGSPRKNWNTHKLLIEAERGAIEAGAFTETIHLYDLDYKGCVSCFACKRKGSKTNGICAIRDDLRPVLERIVEADVLIIGSPIYYGNLTGETLAFTERLLFPIMQYETEENGKPVRSLSKKIKSGLIFTMNASEEYWQAGYKQNFLEFGGRLQWVLTGDGSPVSVEDVSMVYASSTYQFLDYDKYRVNMFDPAQRAIHREKQFPIDLKNAYELGRNLCL